MCAVLNIPRSTYYASLKVKLEISEDPLAKDIVRIFKANRRAYETRRIKKELAKEGKIVSRRRIGKIMKEKGLVSTYTVAHYKAQKSKCNEESIANTVNCDFKNRTLHEVVVSDLTYVRVKGKWHYVCLIVDLHNREIIGFSAGTKKDATLVYQAFASIKTNLKNISIFHTDRGNEFKNNTIEGIHETFDIERSLSRKGCP